MCPLIWYHTISFYFLFVGHALGFFHEQSRADRDSFVRILTQNIRPGKNVNMSYRHFLSFSNGINTNMAMAIFPSNPMDQAPLNFLAPRPTESFTQ